MTNVTMKAVDQLHVSSVKADSLQPGEQFEVSSTEAERLERAGLAKRVGGQKAEPAAPENKMGSAPANKGDRRLLSAVTAPSTPARKRK